MNLTNHSIRILFAEDVPADAEMARREIKKGGIDFIYKVVDTEPDFRKELSEFKPDIIVSDYSMPAFDGMRALEITKEHSKHLPFVVLTGSMNEETAVACMKAGASDYVIKGQITRLPFAVAEALAKSEAIIENERMQEQLHENESMYRSLIENSSDAIYLLFEQKFEIINSEFSKMFGYSFEEINQPGFDFMHLVAPESKPLIEERQRKLLQGEKVSNRYEFTALLKSGKKREVEASVSYINFKGRTATQGIIRDITEKKKMIDELMAAKEKAQESDRLKSAFLANMSHEIRTPMNGIMGFTELLKEEKLSGEEQSLYIEIIQKSGERMLNTINDLIEISKIESGIIELRLSKIDINKKIEYFFNFFEPEANKKGIDIFWHKESPVLSVTIETDEEKFNSILSNLIKNAIKYTKTGTIIIGYKLSNKLIEFFVKDTGIGIEKKHQSNVFNRFIQGDMSLSKPYEGAGLGLSIAKAYIEMLGGEISLESEPGKGSTFTFTLPLMKDKDNREITTIPATKKINADILKELTILVAEDDAVGRIYLTEIIGECCKEIIYAVNGYEAVEIFEKNPHIDIILMDLKMPGMDGFTASKKIKAINRDVLIIAQTAYALTGDREKALSAGCDDYLSKPFRKMDLFELLQKHIGE